MTNSKNSDINMGGYDNNAFKDNHSVNIFSGFLIKSGLIMPFIGTGNTVPNIDGYIELCKDNGNKKVPFATFNVQIKTLPQNYKNQNKRLKSECPYKYLCDTKAFNFACEVISSNPVLLIMVDLKNEFIFWKHLSIEYCRELESQKHSKVTVYFSDDDKICDVKKWRITLKEIYEKNSSNILPSNQPVPEEFQNAFDRLNNTMDNELEFLKKTLFPTTWKFGISYFTNPGIKSNVLGIYKVVKGENNTFFKEFDTARNVNFSEMQYFGYSAEEIINSQLKNWVDILFQEENYFLKIMPTAVIQDIIFHTLDLHFSTKAMQSVSEKNHTVVLDYPHTSITFDKLNSLMLNEDFNLENYRLLNECIDELNSRMKGRSLQRFWEIPYQYRVIKYDRSYSFEPEENTTSLNRKNLEYLLNTFPNFQKDVVKMLGEGTARIFDTGEYKLYIAPDLKYCDYIKTSDSQLKINWFFENKTLPEIAKTFGNFNKLESSGGFELNLHFYWYDIWQTFCKTALLNFIQSKKDDSFTQILHFLH